MPSDILSFSSEHQPSAQRAESRALDFEAAVIDIAEALERWTRARGQSDGQLAPAVPGATLFLAHLNQAIPEKIYRMQLLEGIDVSAEMLNSMPMRTALYGGVAGIGWLFAHLERLGIGEAVMDLDDIDELLIASVETDKAQNFDLINGPVGLGVYFLERLPNPIGLEGLRRIIRHLEETAEKDDQGMRWFTPHAVLAQSQSATFPEGKYDLGMAHGTPGVVALLALAMIHGADPQPTEEMLRETVKWMLRQKRPSNDGNAYTAVIDPLRPERNTPSRSAWCYGDPGIAAALALAGVALDDDGIIDAARNLGRSAAKRAIQHSGVVDVSLCHGSAGLAEVFRMLSATLNDEILLASSRMWHRRTLEMRRPVEEGITGFVYMDYRDGVYSPVADPSFLQGTSGVGLSLLGALNPKADRSWGRLLLLS